MAKQRNKTPVDTVKADPQTQRRRASSGGASGARAADGIGSERSFQVDSELEKNLGYHFARPELLKLALTHRSFPYEKRAEAEEAAGANAAAGDAAAHDSKNAPGTDNEQLEFVGDAVLGLAITDLLFAQFPKRSEGELTRMRASLVSRQRMASFGEELGLGEHLLVGRSAEQNGARRKPALLANAAEAVLAAIYLDASGNGRDGLAEVRRLAEERLLHPDLATLRAALTNDGGRGALRDAKTVLQERVQAEGVGRLRYADTDQSGPAHQRHFTVEARIEKPDGAIAVLSSAEGSSKKEAQQRAAEIALQGWDAHRTTEATGSLEDAENPDSPAKEDAA